MSFVTRTIIALFAFALSPSLLVAQNLINDPSFESGFVPFCNQGVVPDTWYISTVTPDVYSFDCSTLRGLFPSSPFPNFLTLPSAQDGLRFVAGGDFPGAIEAFGQTLGTPLTPSSSYKLSGYFTLSDKLPAPGVFDVYLSTTTGWNTGTLVASIGAGMVIGSWTYDEIMFSAPANAASLLNIIMVPKSLNPTPNSYMASDSWSLTPAPVPTEHETWGMIKALFR